MKNIVIIGYGQLGIQVCTQHLSFSDNVITVSRQQHNSLGASHKHICADLDEISTKLDLFNEIDCLYYFAPPSDTSLFDDRLDHFLKLHINIGVRHIIYISTSGIYGDCHGNWVTEDQTPHPTADRAKRRLNAEHQLENYSQSTSIPITILRCAAIYSHQTINKQRICNNTKPVIKQNQAPFTNRISLKDLTSVCIAAMNKPALNYEIYNVSDGQPSTTTEHAWLLSDLAGAKRNIEVSLAEADKYYSKAYLSYLNESKRLDNTKLVSAFDLKFSSSKQQIMNYLNAS